MNFCVIRMWKTGKRTYCIAVGTFPTRQSAQAYMKKACAEFSIPRDQLHVATYRQAQA